jgi:hypothetical protein
MASKILVRIWLVGCLVWMAFCFYEVISRPPVLGVDYSDLIFIFIAPPAIAFSLGALCLTAWLWLGEPNWRRLRGNVRKGTFRIYLVLSVLWVTWFSYVLLSAAASERRRYQVPHYLSLLFVVPIGGLAFLAIMARILRGHLNPAQPQSGTQSIAMEDYRALLARAAAQLDRNTKEARRELHERARNALISHLRAQGTSQRTTAHHLRLLKAAARAVDRNSPGARAEKSIKRDNQPPPEDGEP